MSGDGEPWSVHLDVRDLGGHLDFTNSWYSLSEGQGGYAWGCYGWCAAPRVSGQVSHDASVFGVLP